jgi:type VI secretion system secreted protein VgrG
MGLAGPIGATGPAGPQGPSGPQGTVDPAILQQIATLQAQLNALKYTLAVDANGGLQITAATNRLDQVGANWSESVGASRDLSIGASDTVTVGGSSTTSVGTDLQLQVGNVISVAACKSLLITVGSASFLLKEDGTITVTGKNVDMRASGNMNLEASGTMTIRGSQLNFN